MISFAKAVKSWNTSDIELSGKYVIQVAVNEVSFDDGSARSLFAHSKGKPRQVRFAKSMYRRGVTPPTRPQVYCPNQSCEVVTSDGEPIGYVCGGGAPLVNPAQTLLVGSHAQAPSVAETVAAL